MSEWDARAAAFEKAQELDAELRFKSLARRNKLIGLWAAGRLGLGEAEAETYAMRLVEAQVENDDDDALAAWLGKELANVAPPISAHRIQRRIGELTAIAAREIFEGR
jgi:hypothetical protein